jgi:hypothetical protein
VYAYRVNYGHMPPPPVSGEDVKAEPSGGFTGVVSYGVDSPRGEMTRRSGDYVGGLIASVP